MKQTLLFLSLFMSFTMMNAKITVDRIEPTDWYVGMKNPSLQLMVYGAGIRDAAVTTDYAGVKIDSLVRLDSPNYLFIYLNIKDAQPGEMTLKFTSGKATTKVSYRLKAREMSGEERTGFTNADVLYMLMPDRFAEGAPAKDLPSGMKDFKVDRTQPSLRHGGDLEGIRQHLDYFNELGVTALWFTPVLENNSSDFMGFSTYHGYATTNYYKVDPRFGTNEDYRRLVDEAHEKGLKVVMDMIFNHCGFDHPWLEDMPSADWLNIPECVSKDEATGEVRINDKFMQTSYKLTPVVDPYRSDIDLKETVQGWFVQSMPDLNQNNPHLMTYLIQNSEWWIETIGINGIRMDTYPYAYAEAMAHWMATLNDEYPNFNVVGETWVTEPAYTATWQKGSKLSKTDSNLKTVMDFSFYDKINLAKKEETDAMWEGYNRIYNSLVYDYLYPDPSSVMAFIENHDTDRFLEDGQDTAALKQALALLLTVRRIPQLYYGTEILMNGTKAITDGYVRKDFPGGFPGDDHDAFTAEGRTAEESAMFDWLSKLLHWRKGNDVITKGSQKQFIPYKGIYVVARQYEGKTVMTVINGRNRKGLLETARYAELIGDTAVATDILTGETVALKGNIAIDPRGVLVLSY
ncbi:MAG: cyclomaltodextrinase N-terminal domain-containing protein [Prevotella sp.]|nr:cyclomaltodextrinase N-terminal domain-containing protein [Prevotella sp.]